MERGTESSVFPKNTTQCPQPGHKPTMLDPEVSDMTLLIGVCFFLCFQGGENSVAIDLIVRHVRTQLEQVRLNV